MESPLIQAVELAVILDDPDLLIFDATNAKDAKESYSAGHIPGAHFIDVNRDLACVPEDFSQGGRHPLPDLADFLQTMSGFGLSPDKQVVVYDAHSGANAAARLWWMLRAIGHEKVRLLDGGIRSALESGIFLTDAIPEKTASEAYQISDWLLPIVTMKTVRKASERERRIIDVRESYRYNGESEPIDLKAGHIPGAVNYPFKNHLEENGKFIGTEKMRELYGEIIAEGVSEKIIHCGSGVTACHTILALQTISPEWPSLYVGSWSEWSRNNL